MADVRTSGLTDWQPRWMRSQPSGYVHFVTTRPRLNQEHSAEKAETMCRDEYVAAWGFTGNFPPGIPRCPVCLVRTMEHGE